MKIKVINPNTTAEMTKDISISASASARPDTEIVCVNPKRGPVTIEGFYDESIALQGLIDELLKSEKEDNVDAYVVACFGDPGIYALRELTTKPVIGIAEAAMKLATFVAGKFSIVTIMPRIRMMLEELVHRAGVDHRLASIRTPDLSVLDFMRDFEGSKKILIREAKDTIEKDYSEAIILGCAGMAGFARVVQEEVGVPVFDAVASGVKIAEALVDLGLTTSKALSYKWPEKKELKGMDTLFQV
jgi:allantoin racemase